jgi:hypothetical protein
VNNTKIFVKKDHIEGTDDPGHRDSFERLQPEARFSGQVLHVDHHLLGLHRLKLGVDNGGSYTEEAARGLVVYAISLRIHVPSFEEGRIIAGRLSLGCSQFDLDPCGQVPIECRSAADRRGKVG